MSSITDGIDDSLSTLAQAQLLQDRASEDGFDFPNTFGVINKLHDEIKEFMAAETLEEKQDELGDIFFVLVNICRWFNINAEEAVQDANRKFEARYSVMERIAGEQGKQLMDFDFAGLSNLWRLSKKELEKRKV